MRWSVCPQGVAGGRSSLPRAEGSRPGWGTPRGAWAGLTADPAVSRRVDWGPLRSIPTQIILRPSLCRNHFWTNASFLEHDVQSQEGKSKLSATQGLPDFGIWADRWHLGIPEFSSWLYHWNCGLKYFFVLCFPGRQFNSLTAL